MVRTEIERVGRTATLRVRSIDVVVVIGSVIALAYGLVMVVGGLVVLVMGRLQGRSLIGVVSLGLGGLLSFIGGRALFRMFATRLEVVFDRTIRFRERPFVSDQSVPLDTELTFDAQPDKVRPLSARVVGIVGGEAAISSQRTFPLREARAIAQTLNTTLQELRRGDYRA